MGLQFFVADCVPPCGRSVRAGFEPRPAKASIKVAVQGEAGPCGRVRLDSVSRFVEPPTSADSVCVRVADALGQTTCIFFIVRACERARVCFVAAVVCVCFFLLPPGRPKRRRAHSIRNALPRHEDVVDVVTARRRPGRATYLLHSRGGPSAPRGPAGTMGRGRGQPRKRKNAALLSRTWNKVDQVWRGTK